MFTVNVDEILTGLDTTVSLSKPLERLHSRFFLQVPDCNAFVKVALAECYRLSHCCTSV